MVSVLQTEDKTKTFRVVVGYGVRFLSRQSRNQTGGEDEIHPRPCGQFWMIRRFTSAQFVPANAGAKAKNRSV